MSKPKFSILSSSYNNAQYLGDWGKSILDQKYRPLEVVFINDDSTDNTVEILDEHTKRFIEAGIEVQYSRNFGRKGYGSCCKEAFELADGPFYGFLDTDDMLAPGAIEHIMGLYAKYPKVAYIYSQFMFCDQSMKPKNIGWSCCPPPGMSLLDMGRKRKHAYSHFRTISDRVPNTAKLFKDGLRSAVDKYLAYRLEELADGMHTSRVCYLYRHGVPTAISKTERSVATWYEVMEEARARRVKYRIRPRPIMLHKD